MTIMKVTLFGRFGGPEKDLLVCQMRRLAS